MNRSIRFARTSALAFLVLSGVAACAASTDSSTTTSGGVEVDQVEVVHGIADRGRDPAVVALDIAGEALCTASLIAPDVVLTARHCVSRTAEEVACPPTSKQVLGTRAPSSLHVLVGDDASTAREVASGRAILTPSSDALCDHDIALIVLDREVAGIEPLPVSTAGIAKGGHVRSIGFGKSGDDGSAGVKLLRDHVLVQGTSTAEFFVGEDTCQGDSGGPAIDDDTGEIVGVVSRGGPSCEGSDVHNIYTRVDAFRALVEEALAKSATGGGSAKKSVGGDAGKKSAPKAGTDMGSACSKGADCSTGICVSDGSSKYCSRACGSGDRCPSGFKCTDVTTPSGASSKVCVEH